MKTCLRIALVGCLLVFAPFALEAKEKPPSFVEMEVKGVTLDAAQNPVVILADKDERNAFPMAIGLLEASAIARELQKVPLARPMTHDLLHGILARLRCRVKEVKITEIKNSTYYASLFLTTDKETMEVDARPSDAIILALKANAPIFVSTKILEEHALLLTKEGTSEPKYGLRVQKLTPSLAAHFNFRGEKGVLVSEVLSGSPSEASGIKAGDIVTKIGDKEIGDLQDFEEAFALPKEVRSIRISIYRDGKLKEVRLALRP